MTQLKSFNPMYLRLLLFIMCGILLYVLVMMYIADLLIHNGINPTPFVICIGAVIEGVILFNKN